MIMSATIVGCMLAQPAVCAQHRFDKVAPHKTACLALLAGEAHEWLSKNDLTFKNFDCVITMPGGEVISEYTGASPTKKSESQ